MNSRSTPTRPRGGMRRDIFGFTRTPFCSAVPYYLDPAREELARRAEGFFQRRGVAFVGGAPGCGKTRFLQHVCAQPDERCVQIAYVPFSMFKDGDILRALCTRFSLQPPYRKSALLHTLQEHALRLGESVNPVIVIDEVQLLDQAALETLRILPNHRFESGGLFSIFLCGGDEFLERLALRVNEPLRQRICACWRIEPLDREHTVFDETAINRIYDETRGVPRLINTLAAAAIETASATEASRVGLEHLELAVKTLPARKEVAHRDPSTL